MKLKFDRLINIKANSGEKIQVPAGELWKISTPEYDFQDNTASGESLKSPMISFVVGPEKIYCINSLVIMGIAFKVVS